MQHFNIHSVDDLVANPSFKKWILLKDEREAVLWNHWLSENPEKLEWVAAARTIVLLLARQQHTLTEDEIADEAAALQKRILLTEDAPPAIDIQQPEEEIPRARTVFFSFIRKQPWMVAASFLLLVIAGIYGLKMNAGNGYNIDSPLFASGEGSSLFFKNSTDSAQLILLPDTTEVILEKGASIRYAGGGELLRREAFLEGDAFFKVAHNPNNPFIVYTKNIVTKVLGTSFWIKASPDEKKAAVIVKTGKVSVFKKEKFTLNDARPGVLEGLVITPNQQVSFDETSGTIKKGVVATPEASEADKAGAVEFDATPAVQVFEWLEKVYNIPIVVDEQALSSCSITASLANESFYEKIAIVCKIIKATYEEIDGSIVITSKGCR